MPHIVMFLPGIMGSVLELDGEVIWPGPVASLVLPYKRMSELLNANLIPTDCIRSFVMPQYKSLLDDLTNWGFDETAHTLVVVPYDWRRSIEEAAQTLAGKIADEVQRHGSSVEITLIAHSMGGLVCRYFLEAPEFDGNTHRSRILRMITIGTPHRGAAIALPLVLGMEKRLFLSADQCRELASDERYPGAYQLLPAPGEPVAWDDAPSQFLEVKDVFDDATSHALGLQQRNLARTKRLSDAFSKGGRPAHVRYFCFSGNQETTVPFVRLHTSPGGRLCPAKVEIESGGDGTVPNWSSTLPGAQFLYVAGEHGTLYKDHQLRRTLARLLGVPSILAAGVPVEIWLRHPVVNPSDVVHARLSLPADVDELTGRLDIEKLNATTGAVAGRISSREVRYSGPVIDNLNMQLLAPDQRGVYRIGYYEPGSLIAAATAELIVQENEPGQS